MPPTISTFIPPPLPLAATLRRLARDRFRSAALIVEDGWEVSTSLSPRERATVRSTFQELGLSCFALLVPVTMPEDASADLGWLGCVREHAELARDIDAQRLVLVLTVPPTDPATSGPAAELRSGSSEAEPPSWVSSLLGAELGVDVVIDGYGALSDPHELARVLDQHDEDRVLGVALHPSRCDAEAWELLTPRLTTGFVEIRSGADSRKLHLAGGSNRFDQLIV